MPLDAPLDPAAVRAQFPALASGATYFDNPGGTQVPRLVLDRIRRYLVDTNANHGGAFKSSVESDAVLDAARAAAADLLGAASPDEIAFGANMTTLTFSLSRALGRSLGPGDEVVVTRLDHDANITPWTAMAEDRGATVRWVDFREEDCTLDLAGLERAIGERTRLVACGYASNAVGTVNDVGAVARMAHAVGALCFVDAVQFVPHGLADVRALDCDFLACSAYKFFGPHVGVLYGKYELLDRLRAYKVRPAQDAPPHKLETGTQNHEGIAGVLGAVEYLEWLARSHAPGRDLGSRREALAHAMATIGAYERGLQAHLIAGLQGVPGLRIRGITDPARAAERVPTVSFTLEGWHPRRLAERLARHRIYTWDGHYYAVAVIERLGLASSGGMLRVGLAHYNTESEIDALLAILHDLAGERA
jgi:cysteine desulfurase family protein (TIGR01976 family)